MQRKPQSLRWRIVKAFWVAMCMCVLGRCMLHRDADAGLVEFYIMLTLAWPTSLIAVWGYAALLRWIPPTGPLAILLMWCFFFGVGWLQWFYVVPFAANRVRDALQKNRALTSILPRD